jgi:excisionase family DNA binding protein
MQLLTSAEAAQYLRLKERKLYELVAERQIPCSKVTGRWLFPRAELDRWVMSGLSRPAGLSPPSPPPIIGGSHDTLLEWALRESKCGLASLAEGSEAGFKRFGQGEVLAAAIHFHSADPDSADANVSAVAADPGLHDAVLLGFATREQGLLIAPGNPLKLAAMSDVIKAKARFVLRPEGAGARQLLEVRLEQAGAGLSDLVTSLEMAPTGPDVAQAIKGGHADCGIATRSVATAAGLGFVSLAVEHFDIVVRQRDVFRPAFQKLLDIIQRPQFRQQATDLGGLDVSGAGRVRWAP